jgi:hypothetical protein
MDHQPFRAMFGAVLSGAGAISNLFVQAHPLLSLACIFVSLVAGIYAIRVSSKTIRHRELQQASDEIDVARNRLELCEGCRTGRIPTRCPISPEDRPNDCPLNMKGNDADD